MKNIKLILGFLIIALQSWGQTPVSDVALTTQANVIRNEAVAGGNTKVRIADMFQGETDSKVSILNPRLTLSSTLNYVWTANGTTGYGSWQPVVGGVSSVFGRTGVITATSNDYTISQITNGLSNVLSAAHFYVGNVSNVATDVALSGDGILSSSGTLSITKILGNTIPSNSNGALTNNGSGTLTWSPITSTLAGDTDVNISSPSNTQLLQYQTSDSKWHNINIPTWNQNTTGTASAWTTGRTLSITGDIAYTSPTLDGTGNVTAAGTLATVNGNVGTFGSATKSTTYTVNAKGLITASSEQTVTPAVGSITGLGTGVATALGINTGSSGSFIVADGALRTPSSGNATNLTGLPLTTGVTGILPVANGGTNVSSASIAAFNNITGYTASGATGTTSSNLVFSASPTFTGTPSLPTGTIVVTQSPGNNSTAPASTAYADAAAAATGTPTPTASTISKWDANKNMSANIFQPGWTSTATAAGTTTLTIGSTQGQTFTGSANQTVTLPVASTCSTNPQTIFTIINNSTGTITVNSSGGNVVQSIAPSSYATISCILASGTTAASWNPQYNPQNPGTSVGQIYSVGTVVNGVGTPSVITPSTLGFILADNGPGVAPSFRAATSDMVKASSTNAVAASGYLGEPVTGTPVTSYTNFTTSATYKNLTSVTLPSGDWIIRASFTLYGNAATITAASDAIFVVSTTTASATGAIEGESIYYIPQSVFASNSSAHISGVITFRPPPSSSSQTWYFNGQGTYTVGNMQYVCSMKAHRPY